MQIQGCCDADVCEIVDMIGSSSHMFDTCSIKNHGLALVQTADTDGCERCDSACVVDRSGRGSIYLSALQSFKHQPKRDRQPVTQPIELSVCLRIAIFELVDVPSVRGWARANLLVSIRT